MYGCNRLQIEKVDKSVCSDTGRHIHPETLHCIRIWNVPHSLWVGALGLCFDWPWSHLEVRNNWRVPVLRLGFEAYNLNAFGSRISGLLRAEQAASTLAVTSHSQELSQTQCFT